MGIATEIRTKFRTRITAALVAVAVSAGSLASGQAMAGDTYRYNADGFRNVQYIPGETRRERLLRLERNRLAHQNYRLRTGAPGWLAGDRARRIRERQERAYQDRLRRRGDRARHERRARRAERRSERRKRRRAAAAAAIGGLIVGGIIANSRRDAYANSYRDPGYAPAPARGQETYGYPVEHHRWCSDRYRSYRAYDGTFQPYHGPRKRCNSPYDGI